MKLYLQFIIQDERYVLSTRHIVEIIPYARLKLLPHAPCYVAGLMNYRGKSVPVIDLCYLMFDRKCLAKLSTRIVLVQFQVDPDKSVLLGILIEGVTETLQLDDERFIPAGVNLSDSAYLGDVITDKEGIVQRLNFNKIIPQEAYAILFDNQ